MKDIFTLSLDVAGKGSNASAAARPVANRPFLLIM
jgi:hypothetical protein